MHKVEHRAEPRVLNRMSVIIYSQATSPSQPMVVTLTRNMEAQGSDLNAPLCPDVFTNRSGSALSLGLNHRPASQEVGCAVVNSHKETML